MWKSRRTYRKRYASTKQVVCIHTRTHTLRTRMPKLTDAPRSQQTWSAQQRCSEDLQRATLWLRSCMGLPYGSFHPRSYQSPFYPPRTQHVTPPVPILTSYSSPSQTRLGHPHGPTPRNHLPLPRRLRLRLHRIRRPLLRHEERGRPQRGTRPRYLRTCKLLPTRLGRGKGSCSREELLRDRC